MTDCKKLRGADVFADAHLNHGLAFTKAERKELGLDGLLPPVVSAPELDVERMLELIRHFERPIDKYLMLDTLSATNQRLFFKLLIEHTAEFLPIVYTPTVGEACQKFSHIFRHPRGLYVSIEDKGRVAELVANCPQEKVDVIVVTDGQRILGLGDQGLNGMGIPVGKLSLYTACAGINPTRTLPVTIDVGTNNKGNLEDPFYMGLRRERVSGEAYDELIEEFVSAARSRWPGVLIQFEDFGNNHAFDLLDRYREKILCFNDDIQGTAAVALAGVYASLRITGEKLCDQVYLFLGAGEAATGIANLIVDAMVEEGAERAEAMKHCWLYDSKGLVTADRTGLAANKIPFAHRAPGACSTYLEALRLIKPTGIVGVSAMPHAFDEAVIGAMSEIRERPVIFALSNPTSKAECDAETAYRCSKGKAIFASGSPFAPVTFEGRTFVPRQGNNSYVFPGLGLGAVFARAKWMPTGMFLAAARELAELVTDEDLENGSLYPSLDGVREVSVKIGAAVAEYAYEHGLAQTERPADIEAAVRDFMYKPE